MGKPNENKDGSKGERVDQRSDNINICFFDANVKNKDCLCQNVGFETKYRVQLERKENLQRSRQPKEFGLRDARLLSGSVYDIG